MDFQINEEEWNMLLYYFENFHSRLSPISRVVVNDLLRNLKSTKVIKSIDQINSIMLLFSVVTNDKEEIFSNNKYRKKDRINQKRELVTHFQQKIILLNIINLIHQKYFNDQIHIPLVNHNHER